MKEDLSLPSELVEKIKTARCLADRPTENRFVTPASVAETLHQRAQSQPDAPFMTYIADESTTRTYTYAAFYEKVRRVAAMLHVYAGIGSGDRMATAMHNHDDSIVIYFAAWHVGASVVPLNMGEDDKRLAYVLEHSGAKALFVLQEYAERMRPLRQAAPRIEHVFVIESRTDSMPGTEVRLEDVLPPVNVPQFSAPEQIDPDGEALVVYTSGTTGVPKGVALSQYNLVADAFAIVQWHGFTSSTPLMCVLPVHHVNGLVVTHLATVFCGGSVVLTRKFSAQKFFFTAAAHGVEVISVVPTLLQFLLEAHAAPGKTADAAPSLRYVICGAGPLTVDLATRFEERFKIPICHGYGLSESTCYSCYLPVEQLASPEHRRWMRDYGYPSIGIPVRTNAMAIHDDNGHAMPEGAKGEIVIRGHNIMLGYHGNVNANAASFTHGWFRSGDEGFFKKGPAGEMYFFISGRFKELIIRGGVKISPLEVDEVLNGIPGVKAAMAVGFENTTYGEEVGAYVVKQPGSEVTEEMVLNVCREKMPFWMSPKAVVFGETFPVTSTGKYQRNQLKPLFEKCRDIQYRA